jgi:benzoyl-CoA-dihydrodiol lyase
MARIDFQTSPERYRHWRLSFEGQIANLVMDVDPAGSLFEGCVLKLNSYDLGVDIELHDAVQRLRFEHPEVRAVILRSGKENVFCSGANIRMLASADHGHKVNFCKFTNETRLAIEDASENSGQIYLAAVSGACAGGGYELALSSHYIMLIDDRRSSVSLPEAPLLAVLPGTGGLTRLTDKRRVRRDRADMFCTTEEGVRGQRAVDWRLVDEVVPPSVWEGRVRERAEELAAKSDRPRAAKGVALVPLERRFEGSAVVYPHLRIDLDPAGRRATITVRASAAPATLDLASIHALRAEFWPLAVARELDDALLHLRFNEPELGIALLRCEGDAEAVLAFDAALDQYRDDWLVREIRLYLKRVFKRLDLTSRSLIAVVEPGSCFAGTLAELALAADRSLMLSGILQGDNRPPASLYLTALNFGAYPMGNGLTRLETRLLGEPETLAQNRARMGKAIDADDAEALGLVTRACDEIDWEDELRMMLEERASFSPDALTALEANLRFAGPETMETRIFGRLTAWQNWVFQRPSAVGEQGALKRYGSGVKPAYDRQRV